MRVSTIVVKYKTLFLAIAVLSCGPGDYKGQARGAVASFHDALNRGALKELYDSADGKLREEVSWEQFDSYLSLVKRTLGTAEATENVNTMAAVFSGRGWLIDAQQKTRFTNGPADEHFVWKRDNDKLRLQTYEVTSPLLLPPKR